MKRTFCSSLIFLLAAAALCMLGACGDHLAPPAEATGDTVLSLKSNIFMLSDRAPFEQSLSEGLIKTVNTGLVAAARTQKKDSVDLLIAEDSLKAGAKPMIYDDIRFFPVSGVTQLKKILAGDYNKVAHLDSLRKFDSTTQFAFVVSHPPAFENILYANFLDQKLPVEKKGENAHLTRLDLTVENVEPQEGVFGSQWQTEIFFIDQMQTDSLMVLFRGDTSYFPLNK